MSIQYRRRIRLLPFLWLNLSKGGWSVSVKLGPFSYTTGPKGASFSASARGTGLSYRKQIRGKRP